LLRVAVIRAAVVAVALVAGAWLVWSLHSLDLEADGERVLERARRGPVAPAEVERARDALRDARRLSADQGPLVTEGLILVAAGRSGEAAAIARRVIANEPENVRAWHLAYASASDRTRAGRALRRVRELNPWLGDSLR
jgi:hypothetical protein